MNSFSVGYIVGSLSSTSINRVLSEALVRLAPPELELVEVPIRDLGLYSPDYDADYPPAARAFKQAIVEADGILFVTPEYNRSIPGCLKNALDWASRPRGENALNGKPTAMIGTTGGAIGTALAQRDLRGVLAYLNTRHLAQPEAYIRFRRDIFPGDGSVADDSVRGFLTTFLEAFRDHVAREVRPAS
ncbi:MAG TPA: NADPH-dependent FMN reductase [Propionibacteriaceae bacterium]|nr:NADPH-dependent FMN reductase [Propionibacteriaceae bacterium]